jgi:hypothetical protein
VFIEITHATTKQVISLVIPKISGVGFSDEMKASIIYCDGGSGFPVIETEFEIKEAIRSYYDGQTPKSKVTASISTPPKSASATQPRQQVQRPGNGKDNRANLKLVESHDDSSGGNI